MKRFIFLLLFATPLFAVTNDDCRAYQQLATLYEVRDLMLRGASGYTIDEAIDSHLSHMRQGWVRWVRPNGDAPFDKHAHIVAAADGAGSDNLEASGHHAFAVEG